MIGGQQGLHLDFELARRVCAIAENGSEAFVSSRPALATPFAGLLLTQSSAAEELRCALHSCTRRPYEYRPAYRQCHPLRSTTRPASRGTYAVSTRTLSWTALLWAPSSLNSRGRKYNRATMWVLLESGTGEEKSLLPALLAFHLSHSWLAGWLAR